MPLDTTTPLAFSRQSLAHHVFDDAPPPHAGRAGPGANAGTGAGLDGVALRSRAGRTSGRARAGRPSTPPSSLSPPGRRAPSRPELARDGSPRAASNATAARAAPPERSAIIDGGGDTVTFAAPPGRDAHGSPALGLDEPVPWNEALRGIVDPGYDKPRKDRVPAPDTTYSAADMDTYSTTGTHSAYDMHSETGSRSYLDIGAAYGRRRPASSAFGARQPRSMGGQSSTMHRVGTWTGGVPTFPASAYLRLPSGASTSAWSVPGGRAAAGATLSSAPSTPEFIPLPSRGSTQGSRRTLASTLSASTSLRGRIFVQTALFSPPEAMAPPADEHPALARALTWLWQRVSGPPRALASACREWLRRLAGWCAGPR